MKGLLLYKGKYGATRQYAEWIGEALQVPVYMSNKLPDEERDAADFLIIGSSVYEGRLLLRGWLKQNLAHIQNKKLFLFIVCATPAEKKDILDQIAKQNIPAVIRNTCTVFFLRGRVVIDELSWIDGLMLKMVSRFTKDPEEKQGMLHGFDAVDRENIRPLVTAVQQFYKVSHTSLASQS